jgi:glycoside hydrolase-like protein
LASTLVGIVASASAGSIGFDTDTALSSDTASQFADDGFVFCVRYLSLSTPQDDGDLSYLEATAILGAGLALMPVQHVLEPGWMPSARLGDLQGAAAAANAQEVGFPAGVNVWLDLEGVGIDASSDDVIAYCNAWFDHVAAAGFLPGLYVGADCGLTGDQLFWDLACKSYWQSGSDVPDVDQRGYQMVQRITTEPDVENGVAIDCDLTLVDDLGGSPTWLGPPAQFVSNAARRIKRRRR